MSLLQAEMQLEQQEENLLDLGKQAYDEEQNRRLELKNAVEQLEAGLSSWEHNYLFSSPICGKVTFMSGEHFSGPDRRRSIYCGNRITGRFAHELWQNAPYSTRIEGDSGYHIGEQECIGTFVSSVKEGSGIRRLILQQYNLGII